MPAHAARRTVPSQALSVLSLAAVLALSGCSLPGLPGPTGAPAPAVEQVAVVAPAPAQDPTPAPVQDPAPRRRLIANDLANGTASHSLGAAENQLVIDYWSTEPAAFWTSASSPIIRLSARVAGPVGDKVVKITRFNARVDALNVVLANDTGDFAIGAPLSYSSAVVLPANPGADSTRIVFTFDLLTETASGTGVFTRQTIVDSLTIGYTDHPAETSAAAPGSK